MTEEQATMLAMLLRDKLEQSPDNVLAGKMREMLEEIENEKP